MQHSPLAQMLRLERPATRRLLSKLEGARGKCHACPGCGGKPVLSPEPRGWIIHCDLEVCHAQPDAPRGIGRWLGQAINSWNHEVRRLTDFLYDVATAERVDGDYCGEPQNCWECGGRGYKIICPDDMCHGQDTCIHGDGEVTCPNCGGSGDEP